MLGSLPMKKATKIKRLFALRYCLPLLLFSMLAVLFWRGLGNDPIDLPSMLIDKPIPNLELLNIDAYQTEQIQDTLKNKVSLLNIWASWCQSCYHEHKVWQALNKHKAYNLYGLAYRDNTTQANFYLQQYGNPYLKNWIDSNGLALMSLGVYTIPETFIIDKKGIIRYRHTGAISKAIFAKKIVPLLNKLEAEDNA